MAKRKKQGTGEQAARNAIERAADARRERVRAAWAASHPDRAAEEARLASQATAADKKFGHKANGTVQTHAHAARTLQGSLARRFMAGDLSLDQLAWAGEIAAAHATITRDARIGTVSLETRVDQSRGSDGAFYEALAVVRAERAYTLWRGRVAIPALALAMIVDDTGLHAAAVRYRMRDSNALRHLQAALDVWPGCWRDASAEVDPATLAAAQAAILGG